mgnify:CR=1 FL=1
MLINGRKTELMNKKGDNQNEYYLKNLQMEWKIIK